MSPRRMFFRLTWVGALFFWLWASFADNDVHKASPTLVILSAFGVAVGSAVSIYGIKSGASLGIAVVTTVIGLNATIYCFANIYYSHGSTTDWNQPLTHIDAVYIAVGTLTTAGTGGITALSAFARGMLVLQMLIDIVLVSTLLTLTVSRVLASPSGNDLVPKPTAVTISQPRSNRKRKHSGK